MASRGDYSEELATRIEAAVRKVPDFPREGIVFRDISTLLLDFSLFGIVCSAITRLCIRHHISAKFVAGMEARGFLFGPTVSMDLYLGFVMLRKPNKLPGAKVSVDYGLEYGKDVLEMHTFQETKDTDFIVVDDLLATGGTALAAAKLLEKQGSMVKAFCFVIELEELEGRKNILAWYADKGYPPPSFFSLLIC